MTTSNHDSALVYAEQHGFFVAPVSAEGKILRPATKNPLKINMWWARWPDAAVGVHLGLSKMVMIEVDADIADRMGTMLTATLTLQAGNSRRYFYRRNRDCESPIRELETPCGTASFKMFCGDVVVTMPA